MSTFASRLATWLLVVLAACAAPQPPRAPCPTTPIDHDEVPPSRTPPPTYLRPAELSDYALIPDDAPIGPSQRVVTRGGMLALAHPQSEGGDVMLVWIDATGAWHALQRLQRSDSTLPAGGRRTSFDLVEEGVGVFVRGHATNDGKPVDTRWPVVWSVDRATFVVGAPTAAPVGSAG